MTDYPPPTPEAIAALKRIDRQTVTLTDHELVEDVDGALMGVTATTYDPATVAGVPSWWLCAPGHPRGAERGVLVLAPGAEWPSGSLQVTEWERSRGFERR